MMAPWRFAVDEQHRCGHLRGGDHRADGVNLKVSLLFRQVERPSDDARREEERGTLRRDRAKVGKRFPRDNRADARVV
jgi:hypothetical protein